LGAFTQVTLLFSIILLSLFTYAKVLNYKHTGVKKYLSAIVFSIISACAVHSLREILPVSRFVLLLIIFAFFAGFLTKTKITASFTATIISAGINCGTFLISIFTSTVISHFFQNEGNIVIAALLAIALQVLTIISLFKIKRFSKGFPFVKKSASSIVGCIVCVVITSIYVAFNRGVPADIGVWFLIGIVLSVVLIIIWWKRVITEQYRKMLKERDLREYEKIIAQKDEQLGKLREDNDVMSEIMHRDNKMLPALAQAVIKYTASKTRNPADGEYLLEQIEKLMDERISILKNTSYAQPDIPVTNNPVFDSIVTNMMHRASREGVGFEISETGGFFDSIWSKIPGNEFQTLFADLTDNAINTTSECEIKHVRISFSAREGVHELQVQDSGKPFEAETLLSLGVKRITTRFDEGGSGIGYMTIFRILREKKASFIISEFQPGELVFTKSLTVRFDENSEFILKTYRADELVSMRPGINGSHFFIATLPDNPYEDNNNT